MRCGVLWYEMKEKETEIDGWRRHDRSHQSYSRVRCFACSAVARRTRVGARGMDTVVYLLQADSREMS